MSQPPVTQPPSTHGPVPRAVRSDRNRAIIITTIALAAFLLLITAGALSFYFWKKHETAEAFKEAEAERRLTYQRAAEDCEIDPSRFRLLDDRNTIQFESVTLYGAATADQVFCFLEELDAPSAMPSKIGSTRSIDGFREEAWGDYEAEWSYHPDDGLNLFIERVKLPEPPV